MIYIDKNIFKILYKYYINMENIKKILSDITMSDSTNILKGVQEELNKIININKKQDKRIENLEGKIDRIKNKVDSFDNEIKGLSTAVTKNSSDITELKETVPEIYKQKLNKLVEMIIAKINQFENVLKSYGDLSQQMAAISTRLENFERYYFSLEQVIDLINVIGYEETEETYRPVQVRPPKQPKGTQQEQFEKRLKQFRVEKPSKKVTERPRPKEKEKEKRKFEFF